MDPDSFINVPSLSHNISAFLRSSILSGKFKPSQRINEREIAETLGVSRSPIREALRDMAKEGLITLLPRKGAIVSELSKQELLEIFEIREMMECYAIALIKKRNTKHFDAIINSLQIASVLNEKSDVYEYLNKTIDFHLELVKLAENSLLYQHYKVLSNSLRRYQLFAATIPSRMDESAKEHAGVLEALQMGKHGIAEKRLKKHLDALKFKIINEVCLDE